MLFSQRQSFFGSHWERERGRASEETTCVKFYSERPIPFVNEIGSIFDMIPPVTEKSNQLESHIIAIAGGWVLPPRTIIRRKSGCSWRRMNHIE